MTALRSAAFSLYFYVLTTVLAVVGLFVRALAPRRAYDFARFWTRLVLWGARRICGIVPEVRGLENISADGPALIASQHQSAYETFLWMTLLPRTSYVLKQELTRIPLFGPLLTLAGMIPVDRAAGASALRGLVAATDAARAAGRQIVIFPEGTRVPPGEHVPLQPGIAAIAARLGLPVIPVATDSGLFWPRRGFRKRPGTLHVVIGPPIAPGLRRPDLLRAIETFWRDQEAARFEPVDKSVGETPDTRRET